MKLFLVAVFALSVGACQYPPAAFEAEPDASELLSTERQSYSAGDTAVIVLTNTIDEQIGYNLCVSALERRVDGEWRIADHQEDRVCTMELRILDPGATATYAFRLDSRLTAGRYRFKTALEMMESGVRVDHATGSFSLTR
jgi:hypothetical protein